MTLGKKTMIGGRQLMILAAMSTIGDSILVIPGIVASIANQDAWLSVLVGNLGGLLLISLFFSLNKRFPGMNLIQMCQKALGPWLGGFIAAAGFLFLFLVITSGLLREIGDFMTTQIMPETPVQAIYLVVVLVMISGIRLGIEPVARTSEIFFPWVLVLFVMLILFVSSEIDVHRLQPLLSQSIPTVLKGSYPVLAVPYMELIVLCMVIPSVSKPQQLRKYIYSGVILGGLVLFIITFTSTLVLGPDVVQRSTYPSYIMAKKISIGNFLERLEVLMAIMWLLTIYFKTAISMYALTLGTASLFGLRDYRPLLLPFGLLAIIMAQLLAANIVAYNHFVSTEYPLYAGTITVLLPLLLRFIPKRRRIRDT
ncbi:spore germination protein KB [Paenibacillus sp. UNCCL117]|uniref:GerAB/ArcD/ProY family transporter n=1 Tax=unclassified Paenibacillus TaxID=185978 RepID=UPI00088904F7|nr:MULTISPECIES: endospore germination permease [unclassified Paenibacillus]SDE32812.1 spore germination protein KB [Paenibacillus sp. cl123]SFW63876.1 spore germination protein KB [Paenibacillus sp. UNCCL117]